jgi:hypothetical protein
MTETATPTPFARKLCARRSRIRPDGASSRMGRCTITIRHADVRHPAPGPREIPLRWSQRLDGWVLAAEVLLLVAWTVIAMSL